MFIVVNEKGIKDAAGTTTPVILNVSEIRRIWFGSTGCGHIECENGPPITAVEDFQTLRNMLKLVGGITP